MKNNTILELMIKDHAKILRDLEVFEDKIKHSGKQLQEAFHCFEWNLEKHLFVEERAIFTAYNPEHIDEGYEIFIELSKEHTAILEKIKILKKDLKEGKSVNISEFKQMLIEHKNFEEKNIYPKLDQEISEGEKRFIIERINEVI
jgi:iron-sulfur cluster repair protein YtfE (RIC family)